MRQLKLRFHCEPYELSDTTEITCIDRSTNEILHTVTVPKCLTEYECRLMVDEIATLIRRKLS